MAKYGMYPQPVYHATLDDGRTIRMTVWQKANAPEKGFDWEACRRAVLNISDREMGDRVPAFWCKIPDINSRGKFGGMVDFPVMQAKTYAEMGRSIISAHLEQEGNVLADDPLTIAAPAKRRANNAAVLAALKAYMAGKPEAHELAELALAA